MDTPIAPPTITEIAIAGAMSYAFPQSVDVLTAIARHRLSDDAPAPDEDEVDADDDDDDDEDWEDEAVEDDDDWDDDDLDDDDDWDDDDDEDWDDDDDDDEPANLVTPARTPMAVRS